MKYIKRKVSILVAMSLIGVSSANAELVIEDGFSQDKIVTKIIDDSVNGNVFKNSSNPTVTVSEQYKSGNISEIGTRISTPPVDGWGNQIETSIVLKQIVPDGWKATTKDGFDLNKKISWKSNNEQWISVLGKIADQNNFKANVDWSNKKIELFGNKKAVNTNTFVPVTSVKTPVESKLETKPVVTKPIERKPIFSESKRTYQPVTTFTNTPVSQPLISSSRIWHMSKDKTLRGNIEDWAKKEGWTISWDAPDYKIISSFDLTGGLSEPDGPIAKVVKSYEGSEQPLTAKILKGNKVIRIESRNYNQSPVVSSSVSDDYRSSN